MKSILFKSLIFFSLIITPGLIMHLYSNGFSLFLVKTESMQPYIPKGSLIIVKKTNYYEIGDVITYQSNRNKNIYTHRITKTYHKQNEQYYKTKGDNNEFEDSELVNKNYIVGKVFLPILVTGYLFSYYFNSKWLWLSFYFPVGYILGRITRKIRYIRS